MADISQIKLPNNTTYDLKDSKKTGIYYVKGTQTAATGAWTGNIDVPALYTGLTIMYYLPYDGSGNATLNLTLSDGTTTGAKNCYITTGRLTTHYGAGRNIIMTFYKAGDISIKGTATIDDRWICDAYYDTNDSAYYLRRTQTNILAGPNKIFPYTIIMQVADGRWESIVTSSSTGTSKARNTHGFRLGQILFMYANATYNENVRVANNNIWDQHSAANDHRYSFNTANNATSGTTANKPIYIVGALNATDGLFYLDATWWTQTLPSTDDGKLYIYIGDAYDYYRFDYAVNHPIYWFKNGAIRLFTQDAATVTGHTVAKDVPSNAVFTDHTYSGTGLISVNSSGVISTTATANTGTITSVKTTAGAHTAINVTSGAANFNVPTKTSHLTNDSGFITSYVTAGNAGSTIGTYATAEGKYNYATSEASHAEGEGVTSSGVCSHAEGIETTASGIGSHSEGANTIANNYGSHAEGYHTIASSTIQHVAGKFNVADNNETYARIIGGGSSDSDRKNILTTDWYGNIQCGFNSPYKAMGGAINGLKIIGKHGETSVKSVRLFWPISKDFSFCGFILLRRSVYFLSVGTTSIDGTVLYKWCQKVAGETTPITGTSVVTTGHYTDSILGSCTYIEIPLSADKWTQVQFILTSYNGLTYPSNRVDGYLNKIHMSYVDDSGSSNVTICDYDTSQNAIY